MSTRIGQYFRMRVTVRSPDEMITIVGDNQRNMRLTFCEEETYDSYDHEGLGYQLSVALRRLEHGRRQGVSAIQNRPSVDSSDSDESDWDANRRRYRAEARDIECVGASSGDGIMIAAWEMLKEYEVDIDDQTLSQLSMSEFISEFRLAYRSMITDYREKRLQAQLRYLPS